MSICKTHTAGQPEINTQESRTPEYGCQMPDNKS